MILIRENKRIVSAVIAAVALVSLISAVALMQLRLPGGDGQGGPSAYDYRDYEASNGVHLHAIRTSPSNVTLEPIAANVTDTDYFGVNGGFFYNGALLSIAVVDGKPVGNRGGGYGSGDANAKYARGTLVWDEAAGRLSVQVVSNAEDIIVTDRSRYWAQGGISMKPAGDTEWETQAAAENMPFQADKRLRTAAVYDADMQLSLIVSETKATAAEFREAVNELGGENGWVDGIFLDGDGSSQMRCTEIVLPGDRREVYQMIRLLQ